MPFTVPLSGTRRDRSLSQRALTHATPPRRAGHKTSWFPWFGNFSRGVGAGGNKKEEIMRNLLMAAATGALRVAAVPASAQVYMGADPGGAGVQVGPFGF